MKITAIVSIMRGILNKVELFASEQDALDHFEKTYGLPYDIFISLQWDYPDEERILELEIEYPAFKFDTFDINLEDDDIQIWTDLKINPPRL